MTSRSARPALLILAALTMISSSVGCTSGRSTLRLTDDGGEHFTQSFGRAYAGRDEHGNYDVVLIQEPLAEADAAAARAEPGAPLLASDEQPLRHVVHIRVFWRPLHGARADNPAATNAAINWYVLGESSRLRNDMVHYDGAGFVSIEPKRGGD